MAEPAPGAGGVFNTLAPLFSKGYKVVFRQPRKFRVPQPAPEDVPPFSDPRGILPAGLSPASQISYELFEETEELVIPNRSGETLLGIFRALVGEVIVTSKSSIALVVFEGRDVVDLPTADLPRERGGIKVPDKVFLPIFAGPKFINPGDDLGAKTAAEYITKGENNAIVGMIPSLNPPMDSFLNPNGIYSKSSPANQTVFRLDTASDIIEVTGNPEFITYTAIDTPFYRDVVHMLSGAIGQGIFDSKDNLIITFAGPFGVRAVLVYRYAFININEDNPSLEPEFQWRLSESFGIDPPKIEKTPTALTASLSAAEQATDIIDDKEKHYVYNLKDASPDLVNMYVPKPAKTGFSPFFAAAKSDPESPFFDSNFKSQIIPYAKNEFFNQSDFDYRSVFGLTPEGNSANRIVQQRAYTAPAHIVSLGPNARLGVEYAVHNPSRTSIFGNSSLILLAKTRPSALGLTAYRDPCCGAILVFHGDADTVIERVFPDNTWAESGNAPPESQLGSFLLGEDPARSTGRAALMPVQGPLAITVPTGIKGTVTIPPTVFPTAVVVDAGVLGSEDPPVLGLFGEDNPDNATPLFEVALPASATNMERIVQIPPITFRSYAISRPAGAQVKSLIGAQKTGYLESLADVKTNDDLTNAQIKELTAEEWPIEAASISAAALSVYGHTLLAFENDDRIDLAFRVSNKQPFTPVRDVVRRIPEDFKDGIKTDNVQRQPPPVGLPFLLADSALFSLYLFYVYKERIVMKTIPIDIFTSRTSIDNDPRYSKETEVAIMQEVQKISPVVVFDGGVANKADGIEADIKFGAIKFDSSPVSTGDKKKIQVTQYSVCMNNSGQMYMFIEAENRIITLLSADRGVTWTALAPATTAGDFFYYPQLVADKPSHFAPDGGDGESPSAFFHIPTRTIILAFVVESSLLVMRIPEDILVPGEGAANNLANINPQVVYGELTESMKERGIHAQFAVTERQEALQDQFNENISAQRIAIAQTETGHLRLFFTDQDSRLRSLISSDNGQSWRSEAQYIADRTL